MNQRQRKTAVSQDYVDGILRSMADMLVVLSEQGKIQTVNPATCQLLGYREEELIGKDVTLLFSEEEEISVFKGLGLQRLIRKGSVREKRARWKTKAGEKIPVSLSGAALRDQAGKLLGAVIIARNVTERKRLEGIAQEARAYAESIVETVREPLVVLDENLRVKTANRSFYAAFQVNPKETAGQLIYELGNRQWNIPALRELLETILPKKTQFEGFEVSHLFPTIGQKIMLLNARLLQQTPDRPGLVLLAIEDITERKRAEQKIQEAMAVKAEFTSMVSHELRTPLTVIKEGIGIVADQSSGPLNPTQRDYLQTAQRNVDRLARLINDVLDFQRLELGQVEAHLTEQDINALVQESLKDLGTFARQKGVRLVTELAEGLPKISLDKDSFMSKKILVVRESPSFS